MANKSGGHTSDPVFPYADLPSVLRRLLTEIPKRPKPPKLTETTAASWGLPKGGNTRSAISVLRKIGLLSDTSEPQESYVQFMKPGTGPQALAARMRDQYRVLFEASHAPHEDNTEALQSLFNIHSGGSVSTISKQIQTFKALCDYADFRNVANATAGGSAGGSGVTPAPACGDPTLPPINVDLHIHLPENKTTRDYEAIIQDIARYIYGRKDLGREPS